MANTVFLLGGAFSNLELNNYLLQALGGEITNGQTNVIVPYNTNGLFLNTVQQGAQMLNTYLSAGSGTMVCFGHSLGAVVCNYWLNNYVDGPLGTTSISPSNLTFYWIGNSVSPYGGALGPTTGAMWPNWFTDITVNAATPFRVYDIKRQYDGWTDWPTGGTLNTTAELNAFCGQNLIHPNYQNVSPSPTAPGNVSYTPQVDGSPGNITYIWSMTEPVPVYGTQWNDYVKILDEDLRPTIEAAYNRPVAVPTPSYS